MSKNIPVSPLSQNSGGVIAGSAATDQAIIDCLAELKLLTAANNDAAALALISQQLLEVCEKLLDQADQNQAICDKLEKMLSELSALCEKIESGNAEILSQLEAIAESLLNVIDSLTQLCEKMDTLNESAALICEKLDAANESLQSLCEKLEKLIAITEEFQSSNSEENAAMLACLEEVKELLTCPPVTAKGVLTSWGS